jgi:hypothetical protein
MSEVSRILSAVEQGDPQAAAALLPLVYEELRRLAAQRPRNPRPDPSADRPGPRSLPPLVGGAEQHWNSRGHFFAAAAEAMRRILLNQARDKKRLKRGGDRQRIDLDHLADVADATTDDLIALDDALQRSRRRTRPAPTWYGYASSPVSRWRKPRPPSAWPRTADRYWAYARAWLYEALRDRSLRAPKNLEKPCSGVAHFLSSTGH